MLRTASQPFAGTSLRVFLFIVLMATVSATAETRPRYGGTLRVQLHDAVNSLDPSDAASASNGKDRLMMLVYDRLVAIDNDGHPQPALARLWDPDAAKRIWRLRIRMNAKFHDGSPVTVTDIIAALEAEAPEWKVRRGTNTDGDMLYIELPSPDPFLPMRLALPRYSIFKHTVDNNLLGTGPFVPDDFQPGKKLTLKANDEYWSGRPFVDGVEIRMGVSLGALLRDRRLDRDDIVEAPLDQVRPLTQAGQRVVLSLPSELIAIVFTHAPVISENAPQPKSATEDVRVRQAITLAVDHATLQSVVLQKQGEGAQGLLPNWMTGFGFLFPSTADPLKAKQLRTEAGAIAARPASGKTNAPLIMVMDQSDATLRAVADRILANTNEAGINIQVLNEKELTIESAIKIKTADFALIRVHSISIEPALALRELAEALHLPLPETGDGSPTAIYAAEHALMEGIRVSPIVFVPDVVWLHPRVHNWRASRTGEWQLADVWLEEERALSPGVQ